MSTIKSPYESLAVDFASNLAWFFFQFADDTIYACGHNPRHMQLLGALVHNFLLFRAAIIRVVALLQSYRLDGTFMASRSILFEMELFFIKY